MAMVVTPRRNIEVLTHRTANRRTSSAGAGGLGAGVGGDVESDSCFERDDNDDHKQQKSYNHRHNAAAAAATVANSPINAPSPSSQNSFQLGSGRKRRRGKNQNPTVRKGMGIMLIFLAITGCSLLFVGDPASHSNITASNKSTRLASEEQRPRFQQFSVDAPTSCNEPLDASEVDFTLVTQVSTDRLWMMEHHCRRWRLGNETFYPISMAVLTNDTVVQVRQQVQDLGCDLDIVTVQTLSAKLYPSDEYPINTLRNLALRAVKTSHVVYIDIDFWISRDLSEILQFPEVTSQLASDPKAALVIPAFMLLRQCHQWKECPKKNIPEMPLDVHDMKEQILARKVTRFDPTNRGGHGSTRYKEWFKQNREDGAVLIEIDCFLSNRYEPYLVFRYCRELPPFQEPFSGYGKNKMTWVMQLRRVGYTFWQLGKGAFVIHYPHLDSPSRVAWNNAPEKRKDPAVQWQAYKRGQMDQLFVEFREWLHKEVPDLTRTSFCQEKLDDDARLLYDREAFNKSAVVRQ